MDENELFQTIGKLFVDLQKMQTLLSQFQSVIKSKDQIIEDKNIQIQHLKQSITNGQSPKEPVS